MSLTDLNPVALVNVEGDVMDVAWSPDGLAVAYLLHTAQPNSPGGETSQLWLKVGSDQSRALTSAIPLLNGGGSISDETLVRFSPDGKYLLMVDTFVAWTSPASPSQRDLQVFSVQNGTLVWVPPSALDPARPAVTMAVWAHLGDRLYYLDPSGILTWDPPSTVGNLNNFQLQTTWFSPTASLDGRFLAYLWLDPDFRIHDLYVYDLVLNTGELLGETRVAPLFVSNSMVLWSPIDGRPNPYVYESLIHVEANLSPIDSWPH